MLRTDRRMWRLAPGLARAVLFGALGCTLVLSGCRGTKVTHPAPRAPAAAYKDKGVELRPGLVLNVSVIAAGKKEIDESAKRISDNSTLVLPLLGSVSTQHHTLDSLAEALTTMYQEYYLDPQIIVDFVRDSDLEGASPWGYVTVLGRVKAPGRIAIPATRDMTVSGAIQKAGGFSTSAKTDGILVTRRSAKDKRTPRTIDLQAVGAGGRVEDDIVVEADDVVFVPEKRF